MSGLSFHLCVLKSGIVILLLLESALALKTNVELNHIMHKISNLQKLPKGQNQFCYNSKYEIKQYLRTSKKQFN